jgi:hypothetical protein
LPARIRIAAALHPTLDTAPFHGVSMTPALPARRRTPSRLLVLGAALAAGVFLAIATAPDDATRHRARPAIVIVADATAADAPAAVKPPSDAAAEPADKAGVDAEVSIGEKGVVIKRRRGPDHTADVVVDGQEFDSFEQFVEKAPWLAGLVFMVTALVFLVPLIVIILVIWYKMRSNRLRNETMLKLAERGVVAPGVAMEAVGTPGVSLQSLPATAPLYEQAKQVRKRAAWSDLRKGVILGGLGLGLTFWSMLDDGTANGFGLVLLFVGIGYVILWYFEERQLGTRPGAPTDPKGGV